MAGEITFYIKGDNEYKISLYASSNFNNPVISKSVINEELLMPDKTWLTNNTKFIEYTAQIEYRDSDLITRVTRYDLCRFFKVLSENYVCREREIMTYRYNVEKEYYDDNYHINVEGYIKDINDYRYFYNLKPITNIIEVPKENIIKEYCETFNVKTDIEVENCSPDCIADLVFKTNNLKNQAEIENAINNTISNENLDLFVFAITDIVNSNSEAIVLGKRTDIVEKAYNVKLENNRAFLPGVVSRKKQMLPVMQENA